MQETYIMARFTALKLDWTYEEIPLRILQIWREFTNLKLKILSTSKLSLSTSNCRKGYYNGRAIIKLVRGVKYSHVIDMDSEIPFHNLCCYVFRTLKFENL